MEERQSSRGWHASRASLVGTSWINILLAIWVIVSPFVLAFADRPRLMWNNVATGCAIGILAILRTSMRNQPGWSWANVVLGVWLIISPLVLVYVIGSNALWNNVILGIIITILAWSNSAAAVRATA